MKTVTVQISESAVKRCLKDESVRELRDPRYPLRLRIHSARTGGSWYLVRHERGATKWQKLANYPAVQVKTVLEHMQNMLLSHTTPGEFSTVGDLVNWYLKRLKADSTCSVSYNTSESSYVRCHILPRLGDVELSALSRQVIDERLVMPLQRSLKISTIKQIFAALKKASKTAHELDMLPSDPMQGYKFSGFAKVDRRPKQGKLRSDHIGQVFDGIESARIPEGMLVMLMLMFGTRLGETRQARWSQFDRVNGFWHIPGVNTKNKEPHKLPMTDYVWQVLDAYRDHQKGYAGDFLFTTGRGAWSKVVANRAVQKVSGRLWTAHDLRKLARTVWADMGVDKGVGEALLNHKQGDIISAYVQTNMEHWQREALENYHEWLQRQTKHATQNDDSSATRTFMSKPIAAENGGACGPSMLLASGENKRAE